MRIKCSAFEHRAITIQHYDAPHHRKESVIKPKRRFYVANYFCKNHAQFAGKIFLE